MGGRFEPFRAKSLACEFLEMEAPWGVEIVGCTRGLGASGPPESPAALGPDAIAMVLSRDIVCCMVLYGLYGIELGEKFILVSRGEELDPSPGPGP